MNIRKLLIIMLLVPSYAKALSANMVWFEFRPRGGYRVWVEYTVPSLKEKRIAYSDFDKKQDAEGVYFKLMQGADFYLPTQNKIQFQEKPTEFEAW